MSEKLELLPSRIETSYVDIHQLNLGVQLAGGTLLQAMSPSNAAVVVAGHWSL